MIISLTVNGEHRTFEVTGHESLLWALRERLGLTGAKDVCEQGECGSCSVMLDGDLVCSCLVLAGAAEGATVTTVEGLARDEGLHPVQQAFIDHGAIQCGYCTPGLVVAAAHLLEMNPTPDREEIKDGLVGNLCRCTGYGAILRAVESLAEGQAGR